MGTQSSVDVRFYGLPEKLRPYFAALYSYDVTGVGDGLLTDYLHPEWATLRIAVGTPATVIMPDGSTVPQWPFSITGPTTAAVRFGLSDARVWGLALQPAGWARFVDAPAGDFARKSLSARGLEAFRLFQPLEEIVHATVDDLDLTLDAIVTFLSQLDVPPNPHEAKVISCHNASRDPDVASVADLADRTGVSPRTLERLCNRYFGFPPKTVLRRQRFLRSLAQFMAQRGRNWSQSLDRQYVDQAHFVREFRSFMGVSPSEYADMDHPVIDQLMMGQILDQGLETTTDLPTVLRYSTKLTRDALVC